MHKFAPEIFREYDIRGTVGKNLSTDDAYQLGLNYAAKIQKGTVAVGYDGRISSPSLSEALIKGLNHGGLDVVNVGLVPTPLTYFAVFHLDLDGGIMVTGSHNPPDQNGFKLMAGKDSLHGDDIRALSGNSDKAAHSGSSRNIDLKQAYLEKIMSGLTADYEDTRIGWDAGNGAAGEIVEMLAGKMYTRSELLNTKIDGTFPSHHPDPTVEENLEQLKTAIAEHNLDVGFAFDGDGDRVGVVDNLGRPIWGDQILAILAREVVERNPGAPIVADVKTSNAVFNYINECGGKAVMWKTGHSLVKAKMKELDSPLAGEMSAHIFIKDQYYGYDDGVYAAIRFLNVMAKTGKSAAQLLDELPKMYSSPEMRITCEESRKFDIVKEVKAALVSEGADFSDIDGVRVNSGNGWWLLRASNTGNQLVARAEGSSQAELDGLLASLKSYLKKSGVTI